MTAQAVLASFAVGVELPVQAIRGWRSNDAFNELLSLTKGLTYASRIAAR
jgi:hypothetical protein